jgi:hypothetical protein
LEKMGSSCHIIRKKNLKSPYLKNKFQQITKLRKNHNVFYFPL